MMEVLLLYYVDLFSCDIAQGGGSTQGLLLKGVAVRPLLKKPSLDLLTYIIIA